MRLSAARGIQLPGPSDPDVAVFASLGRPESPAAGDSLVFLEDVEMIGGQVAEALLRARRPGQLDEVRRGGAAQSEVQTEIAVRIVARPAHHLVKLSMIAARDLHAR